MKDLEINETTALILPDSEGDIEIQTWTVNDELASEYVPFVVLEKWVASIRERIITNATEAQKTGL